MTDTLTTVRPARPAGRRAASPGAILAIVLTGQFMALLDASVVNVAAPAIHASLHASGAGLQLVIAGYVITYAVLLVTGARLGDIIGHRTMFLSGVALFTVASLGCGLAGSAGTLVALRFAQGAGAAAMIPQVLSLIQRTFTGAARVRAMSLYSAVLAGGAVVGQVAGGLLITANLFGCACPAWQRESRRCSSPWRSSAGSFSPSPCTCKAASVTRRCAPASRSRHP